LEDIRALHTPASTNLFTNLNSLWHVVGRISVTGQPRPNWSGFMQTVCQGEHSGASTIEMLEIIDLNPSDDNCIYSTLLYVISQAKSRFFPVPNVTFDQPLYIKAVDIAMKSNLDIVIRLGGFHTLMSFLGSIGNMMRGSGLEEVMGLIFGSNTMEHVLSGKAYARAVRGHFILHSALTDLLLDYLKNPISDESNSSPVAASSEKVSALAGILSSADVSALTCLYNDVLLKKLWVNDTDNPVVTCSTLNHVTTELNELCTALSEQSRTARLWLLYMHYVTVLKLFLFGDRTSNWEVHLHSVEEMLGLFAATGHVNYAKCARLYVQQMTRLSQSHPILHQQFTTGNHSIRRTDRFWAGLPPDQVIETTMMLSAKIRGGMTKGRGINETSREIWLGTLTVCSSMRAALSQVTATERTKSGHVDVGKSRMQRDFGDFQKMKNFLQVYSPFRFADNERLVSLCSGVAAGAEDEVNCDQANVIGLKMQEKWDNCLYGDISCKKADQIKPLAHLMTACSIDNRLFRSSF